MFCRKTGDVPRLQVPGLFPAIPGRPDQLSQCLDFAQWAKHQEIRGTELTKLFMSHLAGKNGATAGDLLSNMAKKSDSWLEWHF